MTRDELDAEIVRRLTDKSALSPTQRLGAVIEEIVGKDDFHDIFSDDELLVDFGADEGLAQYEDELTAVIDKVADHLDGAVTANFDEAVSFFTSGLRYMKLTPNEREALASLDYADDAYERLVKLGKPSTRAEELKWQIICKAVVALIEERGR